MAPFSHFSRVFFGLLTLTLFISFSGQSQEYAFSRSLGKSRANGSRSITIDSKGNLYVSSGKGSLMKADTLGNINMYWFDLDVYGFIITSEIDKQGNVWMSSVESPKIHKYDSNGKLLFAFGQSGFGDGQLLDVISIATDLTENVWVMDRNSATGLTRIQKFDGNGQLLQSFSSYGSKDGQMSYPTDMVIDKQSNIWIADSGNKRIQKFDSTGKFLLKLFPSPSGSPIIGYKLALDSSDNIWILNGDANPPVVQKIDKQGKVLFTFNVKVLSDGTSTNPTDLAFDQAGNLWITDSYSVHKYHVSGQFLKKILPLDFNLPDPSQLFLPINIVPDNHGYAWVFDGQLKKFSANGQLMDTLGTTNGKFGYLTDMAVDKNNDLWLLDGRCNCVKKIDANGNLLLQFGSYGSGIGQFINSGLNASKLTIDYQGNIWVMDSGNYRVQKFNPSGKFLLKFGYAEDPINSFGMPSGIATDKEGSVWVLDNNKPAAMKFDANGKFLFKFGSRSGGNGFLDDTKDIRIDSQGNIWTFNGGHGFSGKLQKFSPNGTFLDKIDVEGYSTGSFSFDKYDNIYLTTGLGAFVYSPVNAIRQTWIEGRVYADENQNCTFDQTDKPLTDIIVKAQPGDYYGYSDKQGYYQIPVNPGTYTVSQVLAGDYGRIIQPICPADNLSSPVKVVSSATIPTVDFGNKVSVFSYVSVNVSSNRRRRCFTNTTSIYFTNTGYADASQVQVHVKMPSHVILKSADKPYTLAKDSTYVFAVGTLKANQSGTIHIIDSVACVADIRGLTACTKVWITPANNYTLPPDSPWDKSDIMLTGKCIENGRVQLVIKNIGQASMADSTEFRIFLDAQLVFRRNYKLFKGDSLALKVPANGKTIRLEADQRPGHPRKSQSSLTLEGCVATTSEIISKGFVDVLPQDDAEPEVAINCLPIIDSFDPNDKLVSPAGTTGDHYTPTNINLTYTIRFQNTGTDYAYTVTVVDTISANLNIATLQMGAFSHNYTLNVSGKGKPVLTWTFANINLPDSTRDQAGSNGFVQFTIKPKENLPEKASIENFADIFFDYNEAVRTNTTVSVLYDVPKLINPANQLDDSIIQPRSGSLQQKLMLYPNPVQGKLWIQSLDRSVIFGQVTMYNLLGQQQAITVSQSDSQTLQVNLQSKPKGVYLVHIQTNQGVSVQKVICQ